MEARLSLKVFLSYHFDCAHLEHEVLIHRIRYYLSKQPGLEPYCWAGSVDDPNWQEQVGQEVTQCNRFVLFVGSEMGDVQLAEAAAFQRANVKEISAHAVCVRMPEACPIPSEISWYRACRSITASIEAWKDDAPTAKLDEEAEWCAWYITEAFLGNTELRSRDVRVAELASFNRSRLLGDEAWVPDDGLPTGYCFDHEKRIIEAYVAGRGKIVSPAMPADAKSEAFRLIEAGCPIGWPDVPTIWSATEEARFSKNLVGENVIGTYRTHSRRVIVDTRTPYHHSEEGPESCCLVRHRMTLPEAGPRAEVCFPARDSSGLTVGMVVSGGIAPGINAVISSIMERHHLYADSGGYHLRILAYRNGFVGLRQGVKQTLGRKALRRVKESVNWGGSVLGTSRLDPMLDVARENRAERVEDVQQNMIQRLVTDDVDILYVIGGDGSMRGAHTLAMAAEQMYAARPRHRISIVGVPKTTDNDIMWAWQSFGLLSAAEEAKECILHLHTEAKSNPRLCIAQLPGSDSGFVVSYAALASGVCDLALIPEIDFSMEGVFGHISRKLVRRGVETRGATPYALVIMAETAIPTDCDEYLDDPGVDLQDDEKAAIRKFEADGRRVRGQTPEALRRAGLKIVSRVLETRIRAMGTNWEHFRVFTSEPRHLIRSVSPGVQDAVSGQRLGSLAVDNAMAGYTDFMISQWLTEYVLVPLKLVVLGRKRVPKDGIFWKSVLACTGQPDNLVTP